MEEPASEGDLAVAERQIQEVRALITQDRQHITLLQTLVSILYASLLSQMDYDLILTAFAAHGLLLPPAFI